MTSPNTPVDVEALKASSSSGAERESSASPAHPIGGLSTGRVTVETAAIRLPGYTFTLPRPNRHHNVIWWLSAFGIPSGALHDQGFVLSNGRYVRRVRAAEVALAAGQVERLHAPPNLFSEDLWDGGSDLPLPHQIARFIGAAGEAEAALSATDELIAGLMAISGHFESSGYAHGRHIDKARIANQAASALSRLLAERREMLEALKSIAAFKRERPTGNPGSYQRGYDIGFNNAGLCAAGIAQDVITKTEARAASSEGKGE